MSAKCQKQTHALQQKGPTAALSTTSDAPLRSDKRPAKLSAAGAGLMDYGSLIVGVISGDRRCRMARAGIYEYTA
jgi:hypothetical protein